MCGIFAAVNRNGYFRRSDYERFVCATNAVKYRGPDASGCCVLNLKDGTIDDSDRFDTFLGHRRLAIIDLSPNGVQPMRGRRRTFLTFNGEIYNYVELKEQLRLQFEFRTETDSEVILAAYETRGLQWFSEFNGEWAFVIADMQDRTVIVSRDRFSIKPLYEHTSGDCHYYASEIKQLLPFMASVEPNREALFLYLNQGLLDCDRRTFIADVRHVPPKHTVVVPVGEGAVRETRYWHYSITESACSLDDAVEEFRELLTDSVRLRLRSDVRIGALLSGGLDSSTLSVIANELSSGGIATYSVVSRDPKYTETPFVDELIRHSGIHNRQIVSDDADLMGVVDDVIFHNDGPPQAFSALAHYRMMESIRKETDITVVLSGQGGDETLLGYRKFFFFYLKQLLHVRRYGSALLAVLGSMLQRTAIWQFHLGQARRYRKRGGRNVHPYLRENGPIAPVFDCGNMWERQIADLDKYSVPNLTHYEDRNAMAFGLETRLPFLDHRLVNFALSMPTEFKIRNGWSKYVLRRAFPELPDAIRWRRSKQGFLNPEERWLKVELRKVVETVFAESELERFGVLDGRAFLRYYADFISNRRSIWHTDISRALMAELWIRSMSRGRDSESVPMPSIALSSRFGLEKRVGAARL